VNNLTRAVLRVSRISVGWVAAAVLIEQKPEYRSSSYKQPNVRLEKETLARSGGHWKFTAFPS